MWQLSTSKGIARNFNINGAFSNLPRLESGCSQPYIAIPILGTLQVRSEIIALMEELNTWISNRKLKISGPLFYRYWIMSYTDEPLTMEVGFPVCTAVAGDNRVKAGNIPMGTFATLVHCGHPDTINRSADLLQSWAKQQSLQCRKHRQDNHDVWTGYFEFYLTNPANEPNPQKWRTALAFLIE
jgi:effector-binding domain-containing protein